MANKFVNAQKNSKGNEDSLDNLKEDKEFSGEVNYAISGSKSKRLIRWVNPQQALVLSFKHSHIGKSSTKDPLFKSTHGLEYRIPKRMVSLDEKYLRRCLELIHLRSSRTVRLNVSEKIGFLSETLSHSEMRSRDAFDSTRLVFECPVVAGTGSVVVGPSGQWILGTIMGSKSMMNIMKSPLFQQYGDSKVNLTGINYDEVNGSICHDFMDSPSPSKVSSPLRLDKGTPIRKRHIYGTDNSLKRRLSMSSTNSVCSDQTSSSVSTSINQGMLQCTWKGGHPHFVFTMDDNKDVYVANLWKVESRDEKALDYVYLFHSGKSGQKDHEICDGQSHLVGKMKVSNSFTLGINNAKVLETQFVLFGGNGSHIMDMPTPSHNLKKSKGLSRKVAEAFRTSSSAKQKTTSKFSGPCAIQENSSLESGLDTGDNLDATGGPTFLDDHPPPNFELAAIVVKDHIPNTEKEEAGGWGLKFLKKVGVKQTSKAKESSSLPFECFRNTEDCSTSMDILIPAGLHGGPRTRNGGPSSLTERWKSGGNCDCGGWDVGCPLTLLKPRSNIDEVPHEQEEFKSFDLVTQGSQHGSPALRIVNVQDNLYFVHFQRTLSILQSFSIAVAIIHTRSPTLRPKDVHQLK